jgi:transcriptional regulator with XRE-family HTH domain
MLLRLRRIAAGLRQRDVAARGGIPPTRLSAIERGEQQPSDLDRKILERILPALPGVSGRAGNRNNDDQELAVDAVCSR